jgi:hypothetical protein
MHRTKVAIFLASLCWALPCFAEVTIANLLDSVRAIPSGELDEEVIDLVRSSYEAANAPQLFYAAAVESQNGQGVATVRYLLAGQIRSTADLALFEPRSKADESSMAALYGMIFYAFGGAGSEEYYRDETVYRTILSDLSQYRPVLSGGYNPGWESDSNVTPEEYAAAVAKAVASRESQLRELIELYSNDEYYSLTQELGMLRTRNPEGFRAGTIDGDRAIEITRRIREMSGGPPIPGLEQ